jgi:SulP family sulfate permease
MSAVGESSRRRRPLLPCWQWLSRYQGRWLAADLIAAIIVTVMLIPQALALALLAGMPPQSGLYAAICGLTLYAVFGSSNTLSVAPVAVLSLMTAAALSQMAEAGSADYLVYAFSLTFLSGAILLVLGVFRLGFMANFLSLPVISAFITASAILIALSQLGQLLGVAAGGENLPEQLAALTLALPETSLLTLLLGLAATGFLLWSRHNLKPLLIRQGLSEYLALLLSRCGPVGVVLVMIGLAAAFDLPAHGISVLGAIPRGLPSLAWPNLRLDVLTEVSGSAILIAIIGFVESVSVGQVLGARRRERIDLDQELVGLGAANIGSSVFGGFSVSGGFSRSMVNFDAGAATPAAGVFAAGLITAVLLFLTPVLALLPRVCLAAIILVAVMPLIDFSMLFKAWRYSKADFVAVCLTLFLTLLVGVEFGIAAGVLASILIHLYKTSLPHVAVVGRVPGTEHFRNVRRHEVETFPTILSIRIDESLYFANTRYLEELIFSMVAEQPKVQHVILMCAAVNKIDLSALETLEKLNQTLGELHICLHLSEVKGPIMDRLADTDFFQNLSGRCFLSQNEAVEALKPKADSPFADVE